MSVIKTQDTSSRQLIDFGVFMSGQFIAYCGTWMQRVAFGWLVWDLTHSPAWVGAVALADLIAVFWIAPLSGAVTDRNNPFMLLMTTTTALLGLSILLWVMAVSGNVTIWFLLAWAILDATVQGFNHPVRLLIVGALAPGGRLSQSIAINSITVNLARSAGPALAGVLIAAIGVSEVFLASVFAYGLMISAILFTRRRLDRPGLATRAGAFVDDIMQGFSYVWRTPHIALLLSMTVAFALLARPFTELFPAIAGEVLAGGPDTLAMLMSAQGLGALLGATWMLRNKPLKVLLGIAHAGAIGLGLSLFAFSLAPAYWLAIFCIGLAGLFHVVANISMQSAVQISSAPVMRGRVIALYGIVFRAAPGLGAFLFGLATVWVPLKWLIAAGGFVFAFMVIVVILPLARKIYTSIPRPEG